METMPRLRALSVLELVDKSIRVYRTKFLMFVGIVALGLLPTTLLSSLLLARGSSTQWLDLIEQYFVQSLIHAALAGSIALVYFVQPITLSKAFNIGFRYYGSYLWARFLMGMAIGLPAAIVVVCTFSVEMTLGWLAVLLILVFAGFLGTRWALVLPSMVVEQLGASSALQRSWDLTRGAFWRVFATSMLATLLVLVISALPIVLITGLEYRDLITGGIRLDTLAAIMTALLSQAVTVLTLPLSTAVSVLIYYDLRVRKEGYDLELMAKAIQEPEPEPATGA